MLESLDAIPIHPVSQVYAAFAQDSNPDKIDLGLGVYRDANGHCPIMPSVRTAMRRLAETQTTKEYMTPAGNRRYNRLMEDMVLGASHPALAAKRVVTIQTPGAGGGLRVAGEMIRRMAPDAAIWVPDPTWDHQLHVFASAGARMMPYPYYDRAGNALLFDRMLAALGGTRPGDVVLLHGCCHNPTGEDLSRDQWRALATLCTERGLVPFIDLVYQGFGDGLEEDVFGTRLIAETCPESIVVASSSKSFGIYRDRAGTLSLVGKTRAHLENAARHLALITSALYFMPPDAGAVLVAEVLDDEALREQWQGELAAMRTRIVELRESVCEALTSHIAGFDFAFVKRQKGMFSLLPLSASQVVKLRSYHGIYMMPDARINLAAVSPDKVERIVSAIAQILADEPVRRLTA